MHQESGLQFRGYVPTLMELLEDADGMVRDTAKTTVIELFRYARTSPLYPCRPLTRLQGMLRMPPSRTLKRQLKNFKVRPAIEAAIVKELVPTSSAPASQADTPDEPVVAPTRSNLAASVSSLRVSGRSHRCWKIARSRSTLCT